MTTKNCANGPKLVLKDLCEKSFVRNDRLPKLASFFFFLEYMYNYMQFTYCYLTEVYSLWPFLDYLLIPLRPL